MFKFHDDPTVNKFEIKILLKHIWVYTKKKRSYDARDISLTSRYFTNQITTVRMCENKFQTWFQISRQCNDQQVRNYTFTRTGLSVYEKR